MKQRWEAEKDAIAALRATKSELERLQHEIETAEREASDSGVAGTPSWSTAPPRSSCQHPGAAQGAEAALAALQGPGRLLKEEVDADDIAEIVSALDRASRSPA